MDTPPRRIISLACSNTEIVTALGCADRLVAVDDHSDFPDEVVAALPRVGPDLDIDVDRVAALEPDLVLATLTVPGHEAVVERLEAAGLPYLAPEPRSLADVYRDIRDIGARLGVGDRAEALVAAMRAELDGSPKAGAGPRPTVVIQWWPKPTIAPGRLSWATDVLHRAGGRNPIGDEAVKSRPIPDDELAALEPDVIVVSWCGVDPLKYRPDVVLSNPALADTPAVRTGRVVGIPEAFLGRPGPRLVEGYRALRAVLDAG
ncbi:MAG: cobalamin-binding protein [Longimicrobiales bacterium]